MKLNNKQLAFVEEYLANGFNGTKAAIKAGYSQRTAYSIANELLKKPEIQEVIDEKKKELAARSTITKEELLADLKHIKDLNKDNPRSANSLKAIEIINKMLGFNMPLEQNINMNVEQKLFTDDIDE